MATAFIAMASPVTHMVKNSPSMWEIWVWSLGQEDPLEEGMVTHSSVLAWRILDTGAWRAAVHWITKSQTRLKQPSMHTHDRPREHIKRQRHHFVDKDSYSQSYGFSSSHVWM